MGANKTESGLQPWWWPQETIKTASLRWGFRGQLKVGMGQCCCFYDRGGRQEEKRRDFHLVCIFHFRSSNNSFLRRGASSNSSLRKHSSQINLWCPSLQQKLPLIQSHHALSNPGTPIMKSPNYSMPRCRSENLMGGENSTKQKLSPSSKPILMTSSAERLTIPTEATTDLRKPSNNTRHVSWGAAASTIRATYRFSHGRPRTPPALSPSSPVLHRQQSRTVMPWKWMPKNCKNLSEPKYI